MLIRTLIIAILLKVLSAGQETPNLGAPVWLGDTHILTVERPIGRMTPKERAAAISQRILRVAEDIRFDPKDLRVVEHELISEIAAGETVLMGVSNQDAEAAHTERATLARSFAERIAIGIQQYRTSHTPQALVRGWAITAIALVLLLLVLFGIGRLVNWAMGKLEAVLARPVRLKGQVLFDEHQIARIVRGAVRLLHWLSIVILLYSFVYFALSQFPNTQTEAKALLGYVVNPLYSLGSQFVNAIPDLITIAVIIAIAFYLTKLLHFLFNQVRTRALTLPGFDVQFADPTFKILRLVLIAATLVIIYPYIPGSETPAFKGVSLIVGAIISFGSSGTVANLISGLMLTYMRNLRVGDRVRIGDAAGFLISKSFLVTRIRTVKNEEITLANSQVLSSLIYDYSSEQTNTLILNTTVTIGYDTPWRQVEAMLFEAARRTPEVLQDPAPFVLVQALNDYYPVYQLNAHTQGQDRMELIYSNLHKNILDVFNEYGVQIMSPNYRGDPADLKIVPPERWYEAPAVPPAGPVSGSSVS